MTEPQHSVARPLIPTERPHVQVELLSQARYLGGLRDLVSSVSRKYGFDDHESGRIALALDEAMCNIIRHGYDRREDGRIWIKIWPLHDGAALPGVVIVIEDEARQVDPERIRGRRLEDVRPGGLGVFIIQEVMDEAVFEKRTDQPTGMRLVMTKAALGNQEKAGSDGHQD